MDAVTYPQEQVVTFINSTFVAARIPFDTQPHGADFNITWTPTFVVLGPEGIEHHRNVGFLDPEGFIAQMSLGVAKTAFDNNDFPAALKLLDTLADGQHKDVAAEAIFLRGVGRYKKDKDPAPLKEAWEILSQHYPDSEWAKRAAPYRLL